MSNVIEWYSGLDNYKKHTFTVDPNNKEHKYVLEILDRELPKEERNIFDIFADYLSVRQTRTVEVLFSGGVDSELILKTCLLKKIPVRALTLRMYIHGILKNTHDLYYSEKFCRANGVEQKFIDLDIKSFYENGNHIPYLEPYYVTRATLATQLWLLEQATGFPIIGGEYMWPWAHYNVMILSPIRSLFSAHDRFMKDRGIMGIGTILDYGYESNVKILKSHINVVKSDIPRYNNLTMTAHSILKHYIWKKLGYEDIELRRRSGGWEYIDIDSYDLDRKKLEVELIKKYGVTIDKIKWNEGVAKILNNEPGENNKFN